MVFKKLLAGLGFGGVDVDTVLSPPAARLGGQLFGSVNIRAKADCEITAIDLLLVANGVTGEAEIGRYRVAEGLRLTGGTSEQVPFTIDLPPSAPFTVLYGQQLPGITAGVRTAVSVAEGSDKGDFDPVAIEAAPAHQSIVDALGTIGCRFLRNELRPGPGGPAQAITFFAPIPDGQRPGPHVPQLTFTFAGGPDGLAVTTELTGRPQTAERHLLSHDDIAALDDRDGGWITEVDRWVVNALDKLASAPPAPPGAFLQQPVRHAGPAYGGRGAYKYGGYRGRPSMAGAMAAGVGGAALGFLGGMMIGDMIGDAFEADPTEAMADGGYEDFGGGFEEF
jgi:sporulation-control protein